MKKIIPALLAILLLSACVHKIDIEQGNVMTPEMASHLHTGMSLQQVKNLMGNPVLVNTFSDNRIDYVYTFKKGHGDMTEKHITLIFRGNILREIKGNMYSAFIKN